MSFIVTLVLGVCVRHRLCVVFVRYVSARRFLCFEFVRYVNDVRSLCYVFDCYVNDHNNNVLNLLCANSMRICSNAHYN